MTRPRSDVNARRRAGLESTTVSNRAADDAAFDTEMVRIMSEAGDLRAERIRIRSAEDARLDRREAAAIETLIRTRARGEAGTAIADLRHDVRAQLEPD